MSEFSVILIALFGPIRQRSGAGAAAVIDINFAFVGLQFGIVRRADGQVVITVAVQVADIAQVAVASLGRAAQARPTVGRGQSGRSAVIEKHPPLFLITRGVVRRRHRHIVIGVAVDIADDGCLISILMIFNIAFDTPIGARTQAGSRAVKHVGAAFPGLAVRIRGRTDQQVFVTVAVDIAAHIQRQTELRRTGRIGENPIDTGGDVRRIVFQRRRFAVTAFVAAVIVIGVILFPGFEEIGRPIAGFRSGLFTNEIGVFLGAAGEQQRQQ